MKEALHASPPTASIDPGRALPTVSICVPTFNGERYLGECIESALAQSFTDFELLVVDDASRDDTVSIAMHYAQRDPRVRVVACDHNLGLVGNWNRSVELARAHWIKFLFQDDLLHADCLAQMLQKAQRNNCEFVACAEAVRDDSGNAGAVLDYWLGVRRLIAEWFRQGVLSPREFAQLAIRQGPRNLVGIPTATMFTRDLCLNAGPFNASLVQLCDAEYWVRLGLSSGIVVCTAELVTHRMHGASLSSTNAATRSFAKDTLDPLVIRHDWLFLPAFGMLRDEAVRMQAMRRLRASFWDGCHDARQIAIEREASGDASAMEAWTRVCQTYPRLAKIPIRHQIDRKLRRIVGLFRS